MLPPLLIYYNIRVVALEGEREARARLILDERALGGGGGGG